MSEDSILANEVIKLSKDSIFECYKNASPQVGAIIISFELKKDEFDLTMSFSSIEELQLIPSEHMVNIIKIIKDKQCKNRDDIIPIITVNIITSRITLTIYESVVG